MASIFLLLKKFDNTKAIPNKKAVIKNATKYLFQSVFDFMLLISRLHPCGQRLNYIWLLISRKVQLC